MTTVQSFLNGRFDRSVSMVVWAYNEQELIAQFLDRAIEVMDQAVADFEIVVVDDGSRDRTATILADYAARDTRIRVITHARNLNVGFACRTAIASATKEFLFWQTVDWSYDLKNLRIFLELLNYYDVVQGVRPTPIRILSGIPILRSFYRASKRSDNVRKAIVSLSNYYLLRILFGLPFHDFQNITIYPSRLIQAARLGGVSSFINPECLFRVYAMGATYIEVPIKFIPRQAGVAKGTKLHSLLRSVMDILRNWVRWGWRFRLRISKEERLRIARIETPFSLPEDVIRLAAPLFREFV